MRKCEFMMSLGLVGLVGLIGLTTPLAAQTILDDDFDDGVVTGWMSQGNTRGVSAHNITESGSVLRSEVVATQSDTHRGIVSTTSFDPDAESGGFTMTFVVTSQGPGAGAGTPTHIVEYDRISVSTIPEPASAAMVRVGLGFFALRRRRA